MAKQIAKIPKRQNNILQKKRHRGLRRNFRVRAYWFYNTKQIIGEISPVKQNVYLVHRVYKICRKQERKEFHQVSLYLIIVFNIEH